MSAAAEKEWRTCTVDGCDAQRVACRVCDGMSKSFCGPHGVEDKTWASQADVFFYHDKCPTDSTRSWEKFKTCRERLCTQCWKNWSCRRNECEGRTCTVAFDPTLCDSCLPNGKRGPWFGLLCDACVDLDAKLHTCRACKSVRTGQYVCHACGNEACNKCSPSTEVDTSPMTLYPGQMCLAYASSCQVCYECMKTLSVEDVQDIERKRDRERTAARQLEKARTLVAEADKGAAAGK